VRRAIVCALLAGLTGLAGLSASAASARPISRPGWVPGFTVTEYFPVPESDFEGALVKAPGLSNRHRVDWLYSARGLTMEGDGIGLDGRIYHVSDTGHGGWVDRRGGASCIGCGAGIFWRAGGYWRNTRGRLTFPLDGGGWFAGVGSRYVPLRGARFAAGQSRPLRYYVSLAVDPSLIPMGSRIYIPFYRGINGGWFTAADTGGAIGGRHVDVYRTPPGDGSGRYLTGQRVYVVPPRYRNASTG
jgi:3D domain-containing protein